jgi:hypothetical protein
MKTSNAFGQGIKFTEGPLLSKTAAPERDRGVIFYFHCFWCMGVASRL